MSDTADHLEREIENHRANVEETLDKLKGRLSVDQVVDDIGQFIGLDDVRGTLASAGRQVRENPLALGLIGVGMVWLMMGRSNDADRPQERHGSESYTPYSGAWPAGQQGGGKPYSQYKGRSGQTGAAAAGMMHKVSDTASDMKDKVEHAASGITERVGDMASNLTDRISGAAHGVTDSVKGMASGVADTLHTRDIVGTVSDRLERQPLLLGAVALVAGAVIGAALPRTRTENRLMGEPRDRLMDQARSATSGMKDRAVDAAHRTFDAAKRAAEEEGLLPEGDETLASKVEHVAAAALGEARDQVEPILHGEGGDNQDERSPMGGVQPSKGGRNRK